MANIGRMHNYATFAKTDLSKSKKNATGFNYLYPQTPANNNHDTIATYQYHTFAAFILYAVLSLVADDDDDIIGQ